MTIIHGQGRGSLLLLHGGAGIQDLNDIEAATRDLFKFATHGIGMISRGPIEVVIDCLLALERCERFNAGHGSALQSDGMARLTASLMGSVREIFSGVIGATYLKHPILLAKALQDRRATVISYPGIDLLARELQMPVESPVTRERIQRWLSQNERPGFLHDTVGCVVATNHGHQLAAGSSTGGRGQEFPGRVSDSGTVAGTYASPHCAITATGVGEHIVNAGLAVRLETRVRDGMSLKDASQRCYDEARSRRQQFGWIAATPDGHWCIAYTTAGMSYIVLTERGEILAASAQLKTTS